MFVSRWSHHTDNSSHVIQMCESNDVNNRDSWVRWRTLAVDKNRHILNGIKIISHVWPRNKQALSQMYAKCKGVCMDRVYYAGAFLRFYCILSFFFEFLLCGQTERRWWSGDVELQKEKHLCTLLSRFKTINGRIRYY